MALIDVARSAVNPWDCDVMGHLNVRHYFGRASDAVARVALELGLGPSALRERGLSLRVTDEHIRFHRELRPGTAYRVHAGVLHARPDQIRIYGEIQFVTKPEVAATFGLDLVIVERRGSEQRVPWPAEALAAAPALRVELPEYGAPRGITLDPPSKPPMRAELIERGLVPAYLGPATAHECDADGCMLDSAFMAKVSDGMPHFFYAVRDRLRPGGVGGAALEYRFAYHERPRAGDLVEVYSGLKALGRKTLHVCHFLLNVESGRCAAASEAVAVSFDLNARKSIDIDDEQRALLQARIIPGLRM